MTDLARLESGHTPSRRHPEYWGGSVPWIGIRDAKTHHGGFIDGTAEATNDLGIANSSARVLPAGTVCLSRTASVGYVVITTRPMATSQDFVNWICGAELEPRFLQYLFLAEGENLLRFSSGAVHQTIYFPEVKAFHVCVPTREQQQRIVALLDKAFEGIATAKANAEKNLQNARELFDAALRSAFSGHASVTPLASLATDISDGDHAPPPKAPTGVPFITISNVDKETRRIDFGDTFTVPQDYYDSLKPHRRPKRGDVLYTVTGSFGIPILVEDDRAFCFQRHIGLIRPKDVVDSQWLAYALLSPQVFAQADAGATGTAQRTVSLSVLRSITVPEVPLDLQRDAVKRLNLLSAEIQRLKETSRKKLAALDELKQSLLHQAFSGAL